MKPFRLCCISNWSCRYAHRVILLLCPHSQPLQTTITVAVHILRGASVQDEWLIHDRKRKSIIITEELMSTNPPGPVMIVRNRRKMCII